MSSKGFFIDSLDGIRALAFFIVFIAHCGAEKIIPGGFGVTIFFFLSGYLITTLLRLEYEKSQNISLKNFYVRRAFRIFPLQYLALFVGYGLVFLNILPGQPSLGSALMQVFQMTNYLTMHGTEMVPYGTGIFWSLSVEEHFYLVFPVLFLYLVRRYSYSTIAFAFLALCGLVLFWRMILLVDMPEQIERIYRGTDTRIDSILFGCILAMFQNPKLDKTSISLPICYLACLFSFGVLVFSFLYKDSFFRETYRYTLQGIALFPIFYTAIKFPHWWCYRLLNLPFVKYFGVLTFGMYLFHYMIIYVVKTYFGIDIWSIQVIVALVCTFTLAHLLHLLVEKPLLALRKRIQ